MSLAEIVEQLKLAVNSEVTREKINQIKSEFYKRQSALLEQFKQAWVEEGKDIKDFAHTFAEETEFKNVLQAYKQKRAEELKKIEEIQEKAYQTKREIVAKLEALMSTNEDVDKIYSEVRQLQNAWKEAGNVVQSKYAEVVKKYQSLMTLFYDDVKISNELRDYDFKKNLETKTRLCEQAEELANSNKLNEAFQSLQKLHAEWRETGPVAKEYREELWLRFKAASDIVNHRHADYYQGKKAEEEANLARKNELCEATESIDIEGVKSYKQWDEITKKVLELQEEWKKTGFAPKKVNAKVYERFRAACDAIFKAKNEFYKSAKETVAANMDKKRKLVEMAEQLKDSKEWNAASQKFVELQKEWKKVGPVSKRASEQIWNSFKSACDYFFEQKKLATEGTVSLSKEREKLVRAFDKVVSDLTTMENNMEFLSVDKKSPLLKQMQSQIDKLRADRDSLKAKIKDVEKRMRNGE